MTYERTWNVRLCCGHRHLVGGPASSVPVLWETIACKACGWQARHVVGFTDLDDEKGQA